MAEKTTPSGDAAEPSGASELILYTTPDHETRIEVRLEGETVWLTQAQMAELFQTTKQNVSLHIQHIYDEGELERSGTVKESLTVRAEGDRQVRRQIDLYNLDVIISVGYRVKSHRGTQFRIWATQRLREYLVKGFALDDERLKDVRTLPGGRDYFDELLERIRDIRASGEALLPEGLRHLPHGDRLRTPARPDADVLRNGPEQAPLGHTRPHRRRSDRRARRRCETEHGPRHLEGAPSGPIRKADATVAKNYLSEPEIRTLNLLVDQYLSFAEFQAQQRKAMTMKDWARKLDDFLKLNERDILTDAGRVSHELAEEMAGREFERFDA